MTVNQFAKWELAHSQLPAWRALSMPAREIYHWLKIGCFSDNNGKMFRSPADLADSAGCNVKTVRAALTELQAKGWIYCTKLPARGNTGKRETAHWRLTMLPAKQGIKFIPATCEPVQWTDGQDYHVRAYGKSARGQRKGDAKRFQKQKPTPQSGPNQHQYMDFERLKLVVK